ncbi:MAG: SIS domain-containing protein [Candidatus Nezhaarchaeales archaeon]
MDYLFEDYLNWSSQLERALRNEVLDAETLDLNSLRGIAFIGMGGSGIVGDMVSKYLEKTIEIPIITVKNFYPPKCVGKNWLAITLSYSGETLETIIAFREVVKRGAKTSVIASGGQLLAVAEELKIPRITVEKGHVPRSALPALLAGTVKLLGSLLNLNLNVERGVEVLKDQTALKVSEELASSLYSRFPVFVVTEDLYPLGLRAKNEFNENSKVLCKVEVLPEWGHNDIVGWEEMRRDWLRPVLFKDGPSTLIDFAADYFRGLGYDPKIIDVGKSGYLETMLFGSWIVGLSSIILAKLRKVDPGETKPIRLYKAFLEGSFKGRM